MDWTLAIERNSAALRRILAMLVAMTGLGATFTSPLWGSEGRARQAARPGGASGGGNDPQITPTRPSDDARPPLKVNAPTLPRHLHRAVLRLLRPAESAARRLVIIAARGVVAPAPRPRAARPKNSVFLKRPGGTGILLLRRAPVAHPPRRTLALPLVEPFKRQRRPGSSIRCVPRILFPGSAQKPFPVATRWPLDPSDPIDATRLALRLGALARVLDDLPRAARRFARWRARVAARQTDHRDAAGAQDKNREASGAPAKTSRRSWPLRPGRAPGAPRRPTQEVHAVLHDLHCLACDALQHPDSS